MGQLLPIAFQTQRVLLTSSWADSPGSLHPTSSADVIDQTGNAGPNRPRQVHCCHRDVAMGGATFFITAA